MNRGQIRALSRKILGETTSAFWTDDELNLYINLGGQDLADKTKCIRTNAYLNITENQSEYSLSSNFTDLISVLEVYFFQDGSNWQKLDSTSRTRLDIEHPGWLSAEAGTPTEYYEDIEEDVIRFYTKPNAANSGNNYARIFYCKKFSEMNSDAESPSGISNDLQLAIVDFVSAYGFQQRGWGDKANDSWNKYYARIKDYMVERRREKEDYQIVMKNYRNV